MNIIKRYIGQQTREKILEAIAQCSTWELEFKLGNIIYLDSDVIFEAFSKVNFE